MRVLPAVLAATIVGGYAVLFAHPGADTRATPIVPVQLSQTSTPDLLMLLELRRQEVGTLIDEGNLSVAYLPAFIAKDIALTLDERRADADAKNRATVTAAAKRIVLAAWRIDRDADLGNKPKVAASYLEFSSAVAELLKAFGSEPLR